MILNELKIPEEERLEMEMTERKCLKENLYTAQARPFHSFVSAWPLFPLRRLSLSFSVFLSAESRKTSPRLEDRRWRCLHTVLYSQRVSGSGTTV